MYQSDQALIYHGFLYNSAPSGVKECWMSKNMKMDDIAKEFLKKMAFGSLYLRSKRMPNLQGNWEDVFKDDANKNKKIIGSITPNNLTKQLVAPQTCSIK